MSTHETLEQTEHAAGHAPSSFDRTTAVTVAIIAALLAGVAMLGHREHNATLAYKTDVARLRVEESNMWAQYQAKRLRQHVDENALQQLDLMALAANANTAKAKEKLTANIEKYKSELVELKGKAEGVQTTAKTSETAADAAHHRADKLDFSHLAVEVGLVICSLALLTKRKMFYYAGVLAALAGVGLAASAYVGGGHHDTPTEQHAH